MIEFHILDYLILFVFLLFSFLISVVFSKREKTVKGYFGASGKLNWFISGTAMVATTFAADTPLAVTELVAKYGISGNWLWWYGSIGSIVTVYFFSHLWRNSGVITDLEIISLRYSGVGADILRIFRSIYTGLFMNVLILSWVNLAMIKIFSVLLPEYSSSLLISLLFGFAFLYTAFVGLKGISNVDTFQFFFAMLGCIILAYFVLDLPEIGGISGLVSKLPESKFHFIPDFQNPASEDFTVESFLVFIGIIWWSSWYPGAEPGGGGYIAQRMLSSKDSKSSMLASLYFTIAHYFIRPWPWILVALSSLVLFPSLKEVDKGYVMVLSKNLPMGMNGFILAVFMAAYLSTIATHLNWGTSYLVNDFYKPYIKKDQSDTHYIQIGYGFQLLMMILSLLISIHFIKSISGVWVFLLECGAGVGIVLILRWFVPRLNAWSELTGFIAPFLIFILLKSLTDIKAPYSILITVFFTILAISLITILTHETEFEKLKNFYYKIKPAGIFWSRWAKENQIDLIKTDVKIFDSFILSALGIIMIFSGLFLFGNLIFGDWKAAAICFIFFGVSILFTIRRFPKF